MEKVELADLLKLVFEGRTSLYLGTCKADNCAFEYHDPNEEFAKIVLVYHVKIEHEDIAMKYMSKGRILLPDKRVWM